MTSTTTPAKGALSLDKLTDFMSKPMVIPDAQYDVLGASIASAIQSSISRTHTTFTRTPNALYASEVGAPCDRKLWYKVNGTERDAPLDVATILKFSMGFMMEELLLWLMTQAGYEVTGEQESIIFDTDMPTGWVIRGRQDAVIDGHKVDVKTASKYGMKKFKNVNALLADDAFGYIPQIGVYSYNKAAGAYDDGYFLVANKETGELELLCLDGETIENMMPDLHEKVANVTAAAPPERMPDYCSTRKDKEKQLSFNCGFCEYKGTCMDDLGGVRSFRYATGVEVHLINPTKIPRLTEIT